MIKQKFAAACVAAVLSMLAIEGAWSQTIKLVVPYTPGSGPDILSRLLAEQIGQQQGQTIVVENRPGGGTVVGTEAVARAEPDGNTLLFVGNSFAIIPALKRGNYDVTGSFEPISHLAMTPMVLVVQGTSPYKKLDDLVAAARAKPGSVVFASGGPASALHVAIEVLKHAANIGDTPYVPYGGNAPAVTAMMGGHVTAVWSDYPTVVGHLQSGTLHGLVTSSAKRIPTLPDVPTLIETGLSKYEADIFYGIVAPAKTPPATLAKLSGWFATAMKAPEMTPRLAKNGLFPVGASGPEFGAYLKRIADDYRRIIAETKIQAK